MSRLGFSYETDRFLVHFGNKNSSIENLKTEMPQIHLARLRQTHSDIVVERTPQQIHELPEGDAQWTDLANTALCISTADCIPCMIIDPIRGVCAGVHAGWRGVQQRIIPKTVEALLITGSHAKNLKVFIGPHIRQESFEIDFGTRDLLIQSSLSSGVLQPTQEASLFREISDSKCLFHLEKLVHFQLSEFQIEVCEALKVDTKTNLDFHSFRRDKENSGRQLSLVVRK